MKQTPQLFLLYRLLYRYIVWLVVHAGPVSPILSTVGRRAHRHLIPHSYYTTVLNPVQVDGFRIYHTGDASLEARMLALGMYDLVPESLLKEILKPGMTVLDIGANIGYFSLLAARAVGETGSVWAFEPTPHIAELLRKNVAENGYESIVQVVPQAVSNAMGSARLHVNMSESMFTSLYEGASMHQVDAAHGRYEAVDVACTTLDGWAAGRQWPPVELVKIDIEGGEVRALEGMVELSRRNPHLNLIIEFNTRTLSASGATVDDFSRALKACGFRRIRVIERGMKHVDMTADMAWLLHEVERGGGDSLNLLCTAS